jgi:alanine or glycine:cation symporter, AGCS family
MGSSPIFSCNVDDNDIYKQSMVSSISVFIDTVVLCTITGIVMVSSKMYINEDNPINFVNNVFSSFPNGNYLLLVCLVTFALATIPCWGYYGLQGVKFIFKSKKIYQFLYKIIYCIFIYIGCIFSIKIVWSISSISNALMVIPNLYMIYYLIKELPTNSSR